MKIAIISGTFFPLPGGVQVEVHNINPKVGIKKFVNWYRVYYK